MRTMLLAAAAGLSLAASTAAYADSGDGPAANTLVHRVAWCRCPSRRAECFGLCPEPAGAAPAGAERAGRACLRDPAEPSAPGYFRRTRTRAPTAKPTSIVIKRMQIGRRLAGLCVSGRPFQASFAEHGQADRSLPGSQAPVRPCPSLGGRRQRSVRRCAELEAVSRRAQRARREATRRAETCICYGVSRGGADETNPGPCHGTGSARSSRACAERARAPKSGDR